MKTKTKKDIEDKLLDACNTTECVEDVDLDCDDCPIDHAIKELEKIVPKKEKCQTCGQELPE